MLYVLLPAPREDRDDDAIIVDAVLHSSSVRTAFLSHCDYVVGIRGGKIVTVRKILTARGGSPLRRPLSSPDPGRPRITGVLVNLGDAEDALASTLMGQRDPLMDSGSLAPVRVVELARVVQGVRMRLGTARA